MRILGYIKNSLATLQQHKMIIFIYSSFTSYFSFFFLKKPPSGDIEVLKIFSLKNLVFLPKGNDFVVVIKHSFITKAKRRYSLEVKLRTPPFGGTTSKGFHYRVLFEHFLRNFTFYLRFPIGEKKNSSLTIFIYL